MADIIETIDRYEILRPVLDGLRATSLDEVLSKGTHTVFAPAGSAWAKLPPGAVEQLTRDLPKLKQILMYHIVEGELTAEDLEEEGLQVKTLQGDALGFGAAGMDVNIANFLETDIEADNGIIHIIDTLLVPKRLASDVLVE